MPELKLWVPTYNADRYAREVAAGEKEEFGDPYFPVVIRPAEGVRIVFGTHDYWDGEKPDIQIERRSGGWVIFLHPLGGGDASGFVFFLDDGRSYVVPETGATPPIKMSRWNEAVREVDAIAGVNNGVAEASAEDAETCELCRARWDSGDGWDGLCPECADMVSNLLDELDLTDEDRDQIVERLQGVVGRALGRAARTGSPSSGGTGGRGGRCGGWGGTS